MIRSLSALVLALLLPGAVAGQGFVPGTIFRDAAYAPEMIVIPPGRALIGSDAAETTRERRPPALAAVERPRRTVVFDRAFAVGRHHVTKGALAVFAAETKRLMAGCVVVIDNAWSQGPQPGRSHADVGQPQREDEPALCVNWDDANAYAAWLSRKTGARYRLLTEAEWEYTARGGTATARWWGDDAQSICTHANGGDDSYAQAMPGDPMANLACDDGFAFTSPVGHFPPNPFGLHDMLGNAWQWVADCYTPTPGAPDGPCTARSIRGGSWHNGTAVLRAATRFSLPPMMRSSSLGFRVMRELP